MGIHLTAWRDEKKRSADPDAAAMAADEKFHPRDLVALLANRSYLFVVLLCATFDAIVFPFQDYLADLLRQKFGHAEVTAGDCTSLIPWGAAVFTIIFGALMDTQENRTRHPAYPQFQSPFDRPPRCNFLLLQRDGSVSGVACQLESARGIVGLEPDGVMHVESRVGPGKHGLDGIFHP
jgi:hypothetical protein